MTTTTSESLHIRIPSGVREELDQVAASVDRSRNWLVVEAIERYLEAQRWQLDLIKERVKEAQSEGVTFLPHEGVTFLPHDEVMHRHEERLRAKLGV